VGAPVRPNMFEHWLIRPWLSSDSWIQRKLPFSFVNGHESTVWWFTVCRWSYGQRLTHDNVPLLRVGVTTDLASPLPVGQWPQEAVFSHWDKTVHVRSQVYSQPYIVCEKEAVLVAYPVYWATDSHIHCTSLSVRVLCICTYGASCAGFWPARAADFI